MTRIKYWRRLPEVLNHVHHYSEYTFVTPYHSAISYSRFMCILLYRDHHPIIIGSLFSCEKPHCKYKKGFKERFKTPNLLWTFLSPQWTLMSQLCPKILNVVIPIGLFWWVTCQHGEPMWNPRKVPTPGEPLLTMSWTSGETKCGSFQTAF